MEVLRLKIVQETAHFRIPTSGAPAPLLTYPLPPPSTVFGFLRRITKAPEINYKHVALSIQGRWSSISNDIERLLFFEYGSQQKPGNILPDKTNVVKIHKLHECVWIIHIKSTKDIIEQIEQAIKTYPHAFRLGRKEDLIIDIEKTRVSLKNSNFDDKYDINKDNYIYMPWKKTGKTDNLFRGNMYRAALDIIVKDSSIEEIVYVPLLFDSAEALEYNKEVFLDGEYPVVWLNDLSEWW